MSKFENFLDEKGRVKSWPSKHLLKIEVVKYIADKFEEGKEYSEKEVNDIIDKWHTYGDYFMIRRGMIDYKLLSRKRDGSKYWKEK
ncbi:DUF2087 domain-containing protein [Clostridium sp. D2Q-11]|uniref:DUF2087 domain-containing protein n=1 Tax=Anaeromonas frigoriresistens TaxID=2683708 RepID=A0A942UTA7_9FIRM|nr:DUF2087 domain-containing protein [Anaeromonas frigoriresistens]MBS4538743.1 DUF2087 domain-containing protein [Anaeromonas frigoriresistens]